MKKKLLLIVPLLLFLGCNVIKTLNLIDTEKLNEVQFKKLREISIEDEKWFKFIKTILKEKHFNSVTTTTEKQTISDEEHKRVKEIIKKYK